MLLRGLRRQARLMSSTRRPSRRLMSSLIPKSDTQEQIEGVTALSGMSAGGVISLDLALSIMRDHFPESLGEAGAMFLTWMMASSCVIVVGFKVGQLMGPYLVVGLLGGGFIMVIYYAVDWLTDPTRG